MPLSEILAAIGLTPTFVSCTAKVFFVTDEGLLSEVAVVNLDPRNALTYPGLYTGALDTEPLAYGTYRVYSTIVYAIPPAPPPPIPLPATLTITAPLQTFEKLVEDDRTKVM
ncbi:MAG: hypothetical protein WC895_02900 [Candidatus Shapirobacteria bacterium]|jgi:hypothetical protein